MESTILRSLSHDDWVGHVTIVGTTHTDPQGFDRIQDVISQEKPDVVAVELCPRRYVGPFDFNPHLFDKASPRHLKIVLLLPLIQELQTQAAEKYGIAVDTVDTTVAIEAASQTDSIISLIDKDILYTFARYGDVVARTELVRLFYTAVISVLRNDGDLFESDESQFSTVREYIAHMEEKHPTFKRVFVDERDRLMASRIRWLARRHETVVVVVGTAHVDGITRFLTGEQIVESRPTLVNPWTGEEPPIFDFSEPTL